MVADAYSRKPEVTMISAQLGGAVRWRLLGRAVGVLLACAAVLTIASPVHGQGCIQPAPGGCPLMTGYAQQASLDADDAQDRKSVV